MNKVFSVRCRKLLMPDEDGERQLVVAIPKNARVRVRRLIDQFDEGVVVGFNDWTSTSEIVANDLATVYGQHALLMPKDRPFTTLADYIEVTYPDKVLDVIETFAVHLGNEEKQAFQQQVNEAFEDFEVSWRLIDGRFIQVDSHFIEAIREEADEAFGRFGLNGAWQEFHEALDDLSSGDSKDAIVKAYKCVESVLQAFTGSSRVAVEIAKNELPATGVFEGLPAGTASAVVKAVDALAMLRHKLGAHGQGESVVEVPMAYAHLAVNSAAVLAKFLTDLQPLPRTEPEIDVDIPF